MVSACRVALIGLATMAAVATGSAQTIRGIQLRSDGPIDRSHVLEILGLAEGKALDRAEVRRGIRTLWALRSVDDVRVTAEPVDGGVSVQVAIELRPLVGDVRVFGASWLWRRRVRDWLDIQTGMAFDQARLQREISGVTRRVADRGYTAATVEPYAEYRSASNTVAVEVRIRLGEPERLAGVEIRGVRDPDRELVRELGIDPGDTITKQLVVRMRRRLAGSLRDQGYWRADVMEVRRRPDTDGTILEIPVDPGPRYRLEIESTSDAGELERVVLRGIESGEVHPSQPESVERHVRTELQIRGHLLASVRARLLQEEQIQLLRVSVDRGRKTPVSAVEFPGAESVPVERLRESVGVHEGRVGGWLGQDVSRETLAADRRSLESLYRELGFAECHIGPPRVEPDSGETARVVFPIDEGPRWHVTEVELVGVPVETMIQLEGELPLVPQGPWDGESVRELRRVVVLALSSSGYPDGDAEVSVDTSTPGEARVRVVARPGPFVEIGDVLIGGLTRTAESVVRGPLDDHGIRSGRPYSLEAALQARRALYELGLFRRVEIMLAPGQSGDRRTVLVHCEEGRQRSYVLGLGWDTVAGTRVTVGWSHLNLFGHAHAFSTEARVSGREVRAQASLREHDLLGLGVPGRFTVYRTEEEFASFSHLSRGLWIDAGDRTRQPYRRWLRYEYKIVNPDAPDDVLSELERRRRKVRIASIAPTVEWDTRDSRLNPQRGLFASGSTAVAFPVFRADAHFVRAEGKLSVYGALGGGTGALGLRLGLTEPLGETSGVRPNLAVPISERFFAGGPVSHRAFPIDGLGVPDQTIVDGEPIGGNALLVLNLEYRHQISDLLTAVGFIDTGNVWSEPSRFELGDMRWGVGVGVRVSTPAGPIRLEYGHKLDRRVGESSGELFLAFGTAF